ncbi:MAG: hypothetical protein FWG44_04030, partial [Oscillospiraceae bacterium]|nr:hypothetical protein [Oscillospiraceae bacterium]
GLRNLQRGNGEGVRASYNREIQDYYLKVYRNNKTERDLIAFRCYMITGCRERINAFRYIAERINPFPTHYINILNS